MSNTTSPRPQVLKTETGIGNEEMPHFEAEMAATRNPPQLSESQGTDGVWDPQSQEQGLQQGSRCGDFICKERGNVPEPFDPIVCREAAVGVQALCN